LRVPSDIGLAARINEPPARLETPNVPDVSEKMNSGIGAPEEDFPILKKIRASPDMFKSELLSTDTNASRRRTPACSTIVALELSTAADVTEYTAPLSNPRIMSAMITSKRVNPRWLI
jgi:hypothetical protein